MTNTNDPTPNPAGNSTNAVSTTQPADTQHTYRRPSYKHLWQGLLVLLIFFSLIGLVVHTNNKNKTRYVVSSQVSIEPAGFFPKTIIIKHGTTIAWTNYDSSPHQVSSDPYPKDDKLASLNSLAMQPKDTYSYTFNTKGTYTYHDNLNPYKLMGTVVVK